MPARKKYSKKLKKGIDSGRDIWYNPIRCQANDNAILENDTENEKQENSRFGKELRYCSCLERWRASGMDGKD